MTFEQINILMALFLMFLIIYIASMSAYRAYLIKKVKDLKAENRVLKGCLDDLYYLVDQHGGFHDQKGSWGSNSFFNPNAEIVKHYEKFEKIYKTANDKTSYYYGCKGE